MDPQAVIDGARGHIDESLLTRTRGGFLSRNVLADAPLIEHLGERETLHYLVAGPAPPTRIEDTRPEEVTTRGSFRTLVAVTDVRMLVAAGSADGDEVFSFRYPELRTVHHETGLLTDAVVIEELDGTTWKIEVGAGSAAGSAVSYASGRLSATLGDTGDAGATADGPPHVRSRPRTGGGGSHDGQVTTLWEDPLATLPDGQRDVTIQEADAARVDGRFRGDHAARGDSPSRTTSDVPERWLSEVESVGQREHPTRSGESEHPIRSRESEHPTRPEERTHDDRLDSGDQDAGDDRRARREQDGREERPTGTDAVDPGGSLSDSDASVGESEPDGQAGQSDLLPPGGNRGEVGLPVAEAVPPRSELVDVVFEHLVADSAGSAAEQYGPGALETLVDELVGQRGRLLDSLRAGDSDAALATAVTIDDLADEGERLAGLRDTADLTLRIAAAGREARLLIVADALGVDSADDLAGALPVSLMRLLQDVDDFDFERFVADLWTEMGYETSITRSSKDKGIDVVARQSTPVEQTVLIQAKRYGPNTKVGRDEVQQYASLHRQEPDADLVVVVTTGEFTGPAREAAPELGVKLVDGEGLVELILERDLFDLVAQYVGG